MLFRKQRAGIALGLALALSLVMPTAMAKDFTVQIPLQEDAPAVTPQQDFYLHVNSDWIKKTQLPADEGQYTMFHKLQDETRGQLEQITKDAVQNRSDYADASDEARIADVYACIVDRQGRNAAGLGRLAEPLQQIEKAASVQEYADTMAMICRTYGVGGGMLGGFGIIKNPLENDRYVVALGEPSAGLGREFMGQADNEEYFQYYRDNIRDMLVLYGRSPEAAAKSAADIFALEKDIAGHSMSLAEARDPSKVIHRMELADLKKLYKHIDVEKMLNAAGAGPADGVAEWYLGDTRAIGRMDELCTPELLPVLKEQAIYALLSGHAELLTDAYSDTVYAYGQKMSGAQAQMSNERKIEELCESILSDCYGRLYAARHFDAQKKEAVQSYLDLTMKEYKQRLARADWLSEATRQEAIKKLDHMAVHIGEPEAWPEYLDKISIVRPENGGCLIDNIMELRKLETSYSRQRLGQPVRRDLWEGYEPQTVNAFYSAQDNSINFPAGILQPPFFDPQADRETNLGGIGYVMAHEITHSFDSSGAQFDENGRLHNWWTPKDYAEFRKRQEKVIQYYNRYVLPDGRRMNGAQTLTENIADLGSMSCLSAIVGHDPEKLCRMYTNAALTWRGKCNEAMLRQLLAVDVHSLEYVRIDAVLSSTDGFYEAYDVQPGDGMYVPPQERAHIW